MKRKDRHTEIKDQVTAIFDGLNVGEVKFAILNELNRTPDHKLDDVVKNLKRGFAEFLIEVE